MARVVGLWQVATVMRGAGRVTCGAPCVTCKLRLWTFRFPRFQMSTAIYK
jgi:hypothetical protein